MLKVAKAVGSPTRTVSELDLFSGIKLPEKAKARIAKDVGDYLVESVLSSVRNAESPVSGEDWPALSKEYKRQKKAEGLPGEANMELEGDMLDSLTFKKTDKGIDLGFFDKEAWKADGHLKFSGKENNTPQRRFLPAEGEEFTAAIEDEVNQIISDGIANEMEFKKTDFEDVSTKSDLYSVLAEYFADLTRDEIRAAILSAPGLVDTLDEMDLLNLL